MRYDDAVASLFQGPLEQFVAERKRLAGELKAAGDKEAAAKLARLPRPPISAWVVDQLWWYARPAFEALFETAQRLRDGQLDATPAHRDASAKLRAEAAKILTEAEHGATEATLRRVTQTLAALAAAGGWEPDLPGALSADRDPPGFEAIGISNLVEFPATPAGNPDGKPGPAPAATSGAGRAAPERGNTGAHGVDRATPHRRDDARADSTDHPTREYRDASKPHDDERGTTEAAEATDEVGQRREAAEATDEVGQRREAAEAARRREMAAAAARAEAAAELRRAEAERAKAAAERQRLEAALRTARGDVAQREREVARLERELALARNTVAQAKAVVDGLEERLARLDN